MTSKSAQWFSFDIVPCKVPEDFGGYRDALWCTLQIKPPNSYLPNRRDSLWHTYTHYSTQLCLTDSDWTGDSSVQRNSGPHPTKTEGSTEHCFPACKAGAWRTSFLPLGILGYKAYNSESSFHMDSWGYTCHLWQTTWKLLQWLPAALTLQGTGSHLVLPPGKYKHTLRWVNSFTPTASKESSCLTQNLKILFTIKMYFDPQLFLSICSIITLRTCNLSFSFASVFLDRCIN